MCGINSVTFFPADPASGHVFAKVDLASSPRRIIVTWNGVFTYGTTDRQKARHQSDREDYLARFGGEISPGVWRLGSGEGKRSAPSRTCEACGTHPAE